MNSFYRSHRPVLPGSGSARKHFKRLLLLGPIALTAYLLSVGDSGFFQIRLRERQLADMQREIRSLEIENSRLKASAALLEGDLTEIERIAREHFGMVKKNESVYMVYPSPPADSLQR